MNMPVADRKYYIMMHNRKDDGRSYSTENTEENEEKDLEYEKMEMFNKMQRNK